MFRRSPPERNMHVKWFENVFVTVYVKKYSRLVIYLCMAKCISSHIRHIYSARCCEQNTFVFDACSCRGVCVKYTVCVKQTVCSFSCLTRRSNGKTRLIQPKSPYSPCIPEVEECPSEERHVVHTLAPQLFFFLPFPLAAGSLSPFPDSACKAARH